MKRMENSKEGFGSIFDSMRDSAVLSDMNLTDIHFVPNTDELNGTGTKTLDRMARFLNTYGGTVRYSGRHSDKDILEGRLAHVREYLGMAGVDMELVKVASMMPSGRGRSGEEAVSAYQRSPGAAVEPGAAGAGSALGAGSSSGGFLGGSPNNN